MHEPSTHPPDARSPDPAPALQDARQARQILAVGQLAADASHGVNNLMQSVVASLELTRRLIGAGRAGEAEPFIGKAIASAGRAGVLSQRLVRLLRPQPVVPGALAVNTLVTDAEDLLRTSLGHAVKLEIILAGVPWQVRCDAQQAEHALIDLLLDARSSIPNGGTIVIETRNGGADHAGAPARAAAEEQPCVYIVLTARGDPVAPPREPRLELARSFADDYGGAVKTRSQAGQWSMSELRLPRFVEDRSTPEPSNAR